VVLIDYVSTNVCIVTVQHLTHECGFIVYLLPQSKIDPNAGHSFYTTDCSFYRASIVFPLVQTVHFYVSQMSFSYYRLSISTCPKCLFLTTDCPFYRVSNVFPLVQTVHLIVSLFAFPQYGLPILSWLSFLFLSTDCPSYSVSVSFSLVQTFRLIVSQFPFP
jgi:hypothetical protein